MKLKKSLLTIGVVVTLGLSASVVSSNKVSAAEVGNTETTTFEIKNNVQSFNQEHLFLESKAGGWLNHIAHTGYWGGGPLGGGESPTNLIKEYYPWR